MPTPAVPILPDLAPLTMSSLEIAELTGKQHSNVLRDIRQMLVSLYGDEHLAKVVPEHYRNRHSEYVRENATAILEAIFPSQEGSSNRNDPGRGFSWQRDERGYVVAFHLDRSHSYSLIAGYDVKVRKRIIDRWMELEEGARPNPLQMLNDPAAMRTLLLGYTEQVIALEAQVGEMRPKVEVHDRIAEAHGSLCVTDAAKTLQVPPRVLFRWLRSNGWIYRRAGSNHDVAYQSKLQADCLVHKVETFEHQDGTEGTRTQVRVTPKGLTVLAKAFPPAVQAA